MATSAHPWLDLIDIPFAGINSHHSPAHIKTALQVFGYPVKKLTTNCNMAALPSNIVHRVVTKDLGPFRATGFDLFLDILIKVFAEYKHAHPDAYADLTTAGCICPRLVRGSNSTPSNHTFGSAIDLGFKSSINPRGSKQCFRGMLDIYAIAKQFDLYWGASFPTPDAMHFEASDELLIHWKKIKAL